MTAAFAVIGATKPTFKLGRADATATAVVPIPLRELWLWQNQEAMAAMRFGLEQASRGETLFLGSFAQYVDLNIDE